MMDRKIQDKIVSRDGVVRLREKARLEGKKVVFTNGCFDIIHRGHVEYLQEAREMGDMLIVAVNTDASVKRIKEKGRPITGEKDRVAVLASLECVDTVCSFDEDTPEEIIRAVRPDILVKGSEYDIEEIVGHEQVLAYGGKVIPITMVPGISTTMIIKKIKEMPD
ncbi:D-glycero-beta-D-manno-heptose 1-phosphate adenylyltransferase [candidate division KSB1 bacterium]